MARMCCAMPTAWSCTCCERALPSNGCWCPTAQATLPMWSWGLTTKLPMRHGPLAQTDTQHADEVLHALLLTL